MKQQFAKRIHLLKPSPTMVLDTIAKKLKQEGLPIINLTAGEPDTDTAEHIKQAAINAIERGYTKYTAPQGTIELRNAVAEKFKHDNNLSYDASQVVIGTGSKQVLYTAFQVLCDEGDEVIIPVPCWRTFIDQVELAGGTPIFVRLEAPFKITADAIEKAITSQTKILLLNSPANPTGAVIDESEFEKIADLAVKHDLWIISDEIYEKLLYEGRHISIASLNDAVKQRTITINGVSKSHAMTGWRIGFAGGPQEVITAMTNLQAQIITTPPSMSQAAALTALTGDQTSIHTMREDLQKRRDMLFEALSQIPQISLQKPEGAFYFFISIEKLLGDTYPTATDWCKALLEKEQVALIPGEAFTYPGYIRLSFAASMDDLQEAVLRIKRFIG